jgi:hydroxyacylglutathione hydrolase
MKRVGRQIRKTCSTSSIHASGFPARWVHGRPSEPKIQVHAYDERSFVLRQSKAVHFEAPFLYLFCGDDRALLLDTGATEDSVAFPLRDAVDGILADVLSRHPRPGYQLVVAHTHAHGDHVAGDAQFAGRGDTVVVGPDVGSVRSFFGISAWPEQIVSFDLGGRVVDVFGIPGHQESSIAVYDRWTRFLVTGDTVCRGRLYVGDFPAFMASMDRLVRFAESRPVSHVMGGHIEMTRRPGRDYPIGKLYQPDEPELPMTVAQLVAVRDAAASVADRPGVHVFDDFIIYHGPCESAARRLLRRGRRARVADKVRLALGRCLFRDNDPVF